MTDIPHIIEYFFLDLLQFLQDLVVDFGPLGLVVAMVLQAIVSPIPSELVLSLAGSAYISEWGLVEGFILAFLGAFVGSILGAFICYSLGFHLEEWVQKRVTLKELSVLGSLVEHYGVWAIVITRLIPFIPFDAISYVAGFAKLKRMHFLVGTIIGLVPRISFYLLLGSGVVNVVERDLRLGLLLLAVLAMVLFASWLLSERYLLPMLLKHSPAPTDDGGGSQSTSPELEPGEIPQPPTP